MSWIKVRADLVRDPAVVRMSRALGVTVQRVMGCLVTLWSWADEQSTDGVLDGIDYEYLDHTVGLEGFSEAALEVGWLVMGENSVGVPNFDRHNGESAKTRAMGARRKAKQRTPGHAPVPEVSRSDRDTCVTDVTQAAGHSRDKTVTREEKRREEKRRREREGDRAREEPSRRTLQDLSAEALQDPYLEPVTRSPEFLAHWADWLEVRQAKHPDDPVTLGQVQKWLREAMRAGPGMKLATLAAEMAASRGWKYLNLDVARKRQAELERTGKRNRVGAEVGETTGTVAEAWAKKHVRGIAQ